MTTSREETPAAREEIAAFLATETGCSQEVAEAIAEDLIARYGFGSGSEGGNE